MRRNARMKQPGQPNKPSVNAPDVNAFFSPKMPGLNTARTNAFTTIDDLRDETCQYCAKPFETTRTDKKYCGLPCRRRVGYEERHGYRALRRAVLECADCGSQIADASRQDQKLCPTCRRAHRLANCKANRERTKAGTNGQRGTNQFSRLREG